LFEKTGSWDAAFYGSAVLALCSALAALGLRRMPLPEKQQTAEVNAVAAGAFESPSVRL
jgi:hypothetical protein